MFRFNSSITSAVRTDMAIGDITTTLGYADTSGFIRAFERWSGISPNAWRKQVLAP